MGSLVRTLGLVAIFSAITFLLGAFLFYYLDVSISYNNQYKQYMYYGANQGVVRMQGIDFSDIDSTYSITCNENNTECSATGGNYEMLESALVKYFSLVNGRDSKVEYKVYSNEANEEVFVTTTVGDVTTTQKIKIGG